VAYRRPNPGQYDHYQAIHQRVYERLAELSSRAGPVTPLVVAAHSLGSVIFSDHVWDEQRRRGPGRDAFTRCETLAGLITFGSNIPLFTLGLEQVKPIAFPPSGSALSAPVRDAARWMNYFDRDDVLGYPLREISPAYAETVHEDVSIGVGSLLAGWTPVSHTAYWKDAGFVDRVAGQVAAVAKAAGL
jgi:alpha-beta hydrolase superfamily lysophospholipase